MSFEGKCRFSAILSSSSLKVKFKFVVEYIMLQVFIRVFELQCVQVYSDFFLHKLCLIIVLQVSETLPYKSFELIKFKLKLIRIKLY